MNEFERIKNNNILDISKLFVNLIPSWDRFSPDSQRWLLSGSMLIGVHDLRARIGPASNPWSAKTSQLWSPPPLKFINTSLSDIMDQRALEIIQIAKATNKKIAIMWSGGIDSTAVVTAFLKNLNQPDHELLKIYCNSNSILENPSYYFDCIRLYKNVQLKSASTCYVNNTFLNQNILLHGDPADCIFGPSTPMYEHFSNNGSHLEPWKKHANTMIDLLNARVQNRFKHLKWGDWYFNYITKNLEESGHAEHVSTVADWWWWTYFNFKWEFSPTRFFHRPKLVHVDGISLDNQQQFANYTFFTSADFQLWSYSNLKTLTEKNVKQSHKKQIKTYINNFFKNESYFNNKRKKSSQTPTVPYSKTDQVGYDNEYKPITCTSDKFNNIITTMLSKWKDQT